MKRFEEGDVEFHFDASWLVERYDTLSYYRNQFQNVCGGAKGVDFVAIDSRQDAAWLIEAKDYTHEPRDHAKKGPIEYEVAEKTRDTLAGLMAMKAYGDNREAALATATFTSKRLRVVLHLEQPTRSKHGHALLDAASIQQKLKLLVRAIDPHPKVVSTADATRFPWTTTWKPRPGAQP